MAMADYCRCEVCGSKAFYDANLNWGNFGPVQTNKDGRNVPDNAGDYAGLCAECGKTYRLVAVPREAAQ